MTDETNPTDRIKRIEVKGLFGLYDHVIGLNLEDRVTILHGPNGVGKTTLLRLVHAFVTGDFAAMVGVPFNELQIDTSAGVKCTATVSRIAAIKVSKLRTMQQRILRLSASRNGVLLDDPSTLSFFDAPDPSTVLGGAFARGLYPYYTASELAPPEHWYEDRHGTVLTSVVNLLFQHDMRLIAADRLLRPIASADTEGTSSSPMPAPAILQYSAALKQRIAEDWVRYGEVSQDLDRTYPTRLLSGPPDAFTVDALKARMQQIEAKRSSLRAIGLLDEQVAPFDPDSLDQLPASQLGVMALYVRDTEQKLGALDALVQRLSVLLRIVNARFRNKSVRADPEHGLAITTHDGRPLAFDALSSGEQHQIILLLDLLFRVPKGALVLIDEPELSLHVLWQKRFLPDLLEIVKVAEIDALIATHSPFIVGDRSDLMVALDADIDHDEPLQP